MTEADDLIYGSERTRIQKADLLTSMAILSGLVSETPPVQFTNGRKDMMIESAAYDIIKQDGIDEGLEKGIKKGKLLDAQEMLIEAIQARFESVPEDVAEMVAKISDRNTLKELHRQAIVCDGIHILKDNLSAIVQS